MMTTGNFLASRIREVYLDGTWIAQTNFKHQLDQIDLKHAIISIHHLNSIAALTYHINYYLTGLLQVIQGGALDIRDKYSFDLPPLTTEHEWYLLKQSLYSNAESFAKIVEQYTDAQLDSVFVQKEYGTWKRNIEGIIEHGYYHLGQVSIIRKMINADKN